MTLTLVILVNAILVGALMAALAYVMYVPFRLDRGHVSAVELYEREDEEGLPRAA